MISFDYDETQCYIGAKHSVKAVLMPVVVEMNSVTRKRGRGPQPPSNSRMAEKKVIVMIIKIIASGFLIVSVVAKSRFLLICASVLSIFCAIMISQRPGVLWYPHSSADSIFDFLLGLSVIIGAAALRGIVRSFSKSHLAISVVECALTLTLYAGCIWMTASVFVGYRNHFYGEIPWLMSIVFAIATVWIFRKEFSTVTRNPRKHLKMKQSQSAAHREKQDEK